MQNVIELEKNIVGLKKITIRAFLGKTQGKLTVRPVKSKSTGRLMGVPLYTEEMRRTTVKVVDAHTEKVIEDGMVINLDDSLDAIDWDWVKYCPEVLGSLEECASETRALFYIENLQKDTEDRIQKRVTKSKAFMYLEQANYSKQCEVVRLLQMNPDDFSKRDLIDYLGELADTEPKKLVGAFEDKMIKVKLFLYGLLDKRIIAKDQDGVYRYGAYVMGTNEKSALDWLQLTENANIIKRLHTELYPAPVTKNTNGGFVLGSEQDPEKKEPEISLPINPLPKDELDEVQARERYKEIFGKGAGNMKLENILEKIREAKPANDDANLEDFNLDGGEL